jgi:acetylornithine deacetylase
VNPAVPRAGALGEVVELHRLLVETRSVSGEEAALADLVEAWLADRGRREVRVERIGNSVVAHRGDTSVAPLILNSHLDTVPASGAWTREPFRATREGDTVYGLGSNDAKASVAAMMIAFAETADEASASGVMLTLVEGEETKGDGTRSVFAELVRRGLRPAGLVFGEPTGLDLAIAQKGLVLLELHAKGTACHVAHAERLGATNALNVLARDLVALEGMDWGGEHPFLGRTTCSPTQAKAGVAHNVIPAEAQAVLDLRTTPEFTPEEIVERVRRAVASDVVVRSTRLGPVSTDPGERLIVAARRARPEAALFGSPTLSDMARVPGYFGTAPAVKVGPGRTERSHTADEFVTVQELIDGAAFYRRLIDAFGETPQ